MRLLGLRWRLSKRYLITAVLLLVVVGFIYLAQIVQSLIHEATCSEEESHHILEEYCQMVEKGQITGDLCPHLCHHRNIRYKKCTNYRRGKHVMFVDCKDFCRQGETVKAVLKTEHKNFSDVINRIFDFEAEEAQDTGPSLLTLRDLIRGTLERERILVLDNETDEIELMAFPNYKKYYIEGDKHSQFAFARSVWSLVQQQEYLMMKAHQIHNFMPEIYGSCGPLYLLEFAPPGDMLEHEIHLTSQPWVQRAEVAKGILQVLRTLGEDLYEPLHLCDVKGENFGISEYGNVKLIDTDSIFFDTKLKEELGYGTCTRNRDCDFFDCRGWCNTETGHCEKIQLNNNLQNVCQDVFLGKLMDTMGGLLRNPPRAIKAELKSLLDKCAFGQTSEDGIPVLKPSDELYWRIHNLLQNSIDNHVK